MKRKWRGSIAHRISRFLPFVWVMPPYGEDVTNGTKLPLHCLVLPKQTTHRRGCRTHHTHNHHKCASEHHRGSDKPPGKLNPNRNAKFAPFFSRGEFGVFCHAYNIISESACEYARTLSVGCRDPPSSDFSLTRKITMTGGKTNGYLPSEKRSSSFTQKG